MATVLLDTTVASLLHPRRAGSTLRALYASDMQDRTLAISFQTVAELWSWAEENRWGTPARAALDAFIAQFLLMPYSAERAQTGAGVMTPARRVGRRLEAGDTWIAASAVLYRVPLLTSDRDFVSIDFEGLEVVCHAEGPQ
jgi:tRNA(fMet)-specific endonuclease VapC